MHKLDNNIAHQSTTELRRIWAELWGIHPHRYLRREILEKSIAFKRREQAGNGLTQQQQKRLDQLVAQYRRDPACFDDDRVILSPGTRLVRVWQGIKYNVLVMENGFEYQGQAFSSLSEIAFTITRTRWNGWLFFGLKKRKKPS